MFRVTSLRNQKLTAAQIRAHIYASQSSRCRHISTFTVQRRLSESGLHGRIAAKKPGTGRRRVVLRPRNTKVQISDCWFHPPCLRNRKGEQMVSTFVVPTMKHGGGGVMV